MAVRDFLILAVICLIWGGNFVLSKWMLSDLALPPFFFASVRFLVVAILCAPFLFPLPKHFGRMALAALCVGGAHLAFLYTGLKTAPASSGAIVSQMLIPFAAILSLVFLKEHIGWRRAAGMVGALIGVVILIYDPVSFAFDIGLVYVAIAFFVLAIGSVLIKGVGAINPMTYLAWMGVLAVPFLAGASVVFEHDQLALAQNAGWKMGVGVAYTAILASIFAHGQYFRMLKTYDVTVVVPLTLMTPFWAIIIGVVLRGEVLDARFFIGSALILPSVYIIAKRQKRTPTEVL